jgi:flagellar basal-body rod modification protein FlgD
MAMTITNTLPASSTMTSQIDTGSAATTGSTSTSKTDTAQQLSDRFMKLLVAQMKNQDPLNPMDNAQVTSQMAQINTVSGINGLNTTVTQLLGQFQQLEAMQAAQLSGRNVLAAGSTVTVDAATSTDATAGSSATNLRGAFELAGTADKVDVEVRDAKGTLVSTIPVAPNPAGGLTPFTWDGKDASGGTAAAGNYTFGVKASNAGSAVTATTYAAQRVQGVATGTSSPSLLLADGRTVAYSDIKQVL